MKKKRAFVVFLMFCLFSVYFVFGLGCKACNFLGQEKAEAEEKARKKKSNES